VENAENMLVCATHLLLAKYLLLINEEDSRISNTLAMFISLTSTFFQKKKCLERNLKKK